MAQPFRRDCIGRLPMAVFSVIEIFHQDFAELASAY
jgi:hypothetical protein